MTKFASSCACEKGANCGLDECTRFKEIYNVEKNE